MWTAKLQQRLGYCGCRNRIDNLLVVAQPWKSFENCDNGIQKCQWRPLLFHRKSPWKSFDKIEDISEHSGNIKQYDSFPMRKYFSKINSTIRTIANALHTINSRKLSWFWDVSPLRVMPTPISRWIQTIQKTNYVESLTTVVKNWIRGIANNIPYIW